MKFDALVDTKMLGRSSAGGSGYVLLNNANDAKSLELKLSNDKLRPGLIGTGICNYYFNALEDSYFNKSNPQSFTRTKSKLFIWVGSVICILILFMASFNFINLLLLSFQSRKKETGIKKTLGVSLIDLFKTTFTEVIIYITSAYCFSLILTALFLPYFNTVLQTNLSFHYLSRVTVFSSIGLVVFILATIVVGTALANQWRVKAISLMQNQKSKVTFNRLLFTLQFVISITMAICSLTIIEQMDFVQNEPIGFNKNIIELRAPSNDSYSKMPLLKENLLRLSFIENVTVCSGNPISGNMIAHYKTEKGQNFIPYLFNGDEDFFKTLNLTLIEGEIPSAKNPGVVVNETLAKLLNLKSAVGGKIPETGSIIVGVVKDFTTVSFKVETPPVIIGYTLGERSLLLSFKENKISTFLPQIEKVWKQVLPDFPFRYQIIE